MVARSARGAATAFPAGPAQNQKWYPSPRNPGSYALSLLSKNPKIIARPVCTASLQDCFKVIEPDRSGLHAAGCVRASAST